MIFFTNDIQIKMGEGNEKKNQQTVVHEIKICTGGGGGSRLLPHK